MALLHPRHLAISLVGRAGWGPCEKTGGSIFCTQMSLTLILETTQARPLRWQEIYKSNTDGNAPSSQPLKAG
jgi:hypothetical protein